MQADRRAGRLAGWLVYRQAGRQASVYATIRINRKIYPINMLKGDSSSVSILLLGSLSIGKLYSESGITAIFPIRRIRILVSTKTQQGVLRVTRRLFGYCRKVAAARYVSSYSKPFGLLPKTLPPGCLSEVGQPVLTLWCSWSIPCTLCRIILSCCTAWYVRCRAMPLPMCDCPLPVPAHG